jgi:hypothetical protein
VVGARRRCRTIPSPPAKNQNLADEHEVRLGQKSRHDYASSHGILREISGVLREIIRFQLHSACLLIYYSMRQKTSMLYMEYKCFFFILMGTNATAIYICLPYIGDP